MIYTFKKIYLVFAYFIFLGLFTACSSDRAESKEEQIVISSSEEEPTQDSMVNSIQGNVSWNQIATIPHSVVLTGLQDHRLVTVYKEKAIGSDNRGKSSYSSYDEDMQDNNAHFMPGIDLIYGFHLLNVAHYDLKTEKLNYLFNHPVLVKSLYYPSFIQDSVNRKPINRNYYLVSVYDEDTNKDTLLNKKDLRRLYHFDSDCSSRTQLIPSDYSVIRSQYDSPNDVMYIFARMDKNKNGTEDKEEPIHIFWISLKEPARAKLLY